MTLRVGLIGDPVEHSLSPAFQQAAFDALGIDALYALWPTSAVDLPARVTSLREPDVLGANVTLPHKQAAFALVDDVTERAAAAHAVNTIASRDGRLHGDNTDIPGFLAPLDERGLRLHSLHAVVLGAGGAAHAVVVALLLAGCGGITVANRHPARAEALAAELGAPPSLRTAALDATLAGALQSAGLLVNATAAGWQGDALPLDSALLRALPPTALVYDLIYRETPLLRAAVGLGLGTLDGLRMLVHQGAESFRCWTDQAPPLEVMWQAALSARDRRA